MQRRIAFVPCFLTGTMGEHQGLLDGTIITCFNNSSISPFWSVLHPGAIRYGCDLIGSMSQVEIVCLWFLTFPNFSVTTSPNYSKTNCKSTCCSSVNSGVPIFILPTGFDLSAVSSATTTLKRLATCVSQGFNLLIWTTWFFELFSNDPIL